MSARVGEVEIDSLIPGPSASLQVFPCPEGRRESRQSAVRPTLTGLSRNTKPSPLGEGSSPSTLALVLAVISLNCLRDESLALLIDT
jgi:hypothetical protein